MFDSSKKAKTVLLFLIIVIFSGFLYAAAKPLDKTKYITIDEIRPGMDAYCLTCFKGTKIEKFGLEVLSVVHNYRAGKDAILVKGTDERFIHTGPVGGCSGSPVYIDGRLAGALAFGWLYSKDPLYGVTAIEDMLRVGDISGTQEFNTISFDFSGPIDLEEIGEQILSNRHFNQNTNNQAQTLPCPVITCGIGDEARQELDAALKPFGLMAVAGIGGSGKTTTEQIQRMSPQDAAVKRSRGDLPSYGAPRLSPGDVLAVPLVSGDITMTAIGTVTEVVDDKVYGFGHSFLGYGPIDFPMATGQIHTVVSSTVRSFKLGSALDVVGALTADESSAIVGRIGAKAKTFPLTIKVDRYNDIPRTYNCQVTHNKVYAPRLINSVIGGAVLFQGSLPPEHTFEYNAVIGVKDSEPIIFQNLSTGEGYQKLAYEGVSSIGLLMDNPYKKVEITSVDFNIRLLAKSVISHIWSVDLADSTIKAGDDINVEVVVESVLEGKKRYRCSLKTPENIAPGNYDLIVSGGDYYRDFLRQTMPYKFTVENFNTLVEAMNNLLAIKRDKLYCLLVLPSEGVAIEKAQLPDLPATKQLILNDAKRTLLARPHPKWIEKNLQTGTVIIDNKVMNITVEK